MVRGVGGSNPRTAGRGARYKIRRLLPGGIQCRPDLVLCHVLFIEFRSCTQPTSGAVAMRNHLFVVLIVLIFSISLNHGEKLKVNGRRAAGLMAYPRVGRSDQPMSNVNINRQREMEPDADLQFYNAHDSDFDSASEKDYEDSRNVMSAFSGRAMDPKHSEKIPKDSSWPISKEYRPWQKIDDGRPHYFNSLLLARGFRNSQMNGYTPRLEREGDIDRTFCK